MFKQWPKINKIQRRVRNFHRSRRKKEILMIQKTLLAVALFTLTAAFTISVVAQVASSGQGGGDMQEKIALVKRSIPTRHHQYQWVETTQLTLKGEAKPPKQSRAGSAPTEKCRKFRSEILPPTSATAEWPRRQAQGACVETEEVRAYMQQGEKHTRSLCAAKFGAHCGPSAPGWQYLHRCTSPRRMLCN